MYIHKGFTVQARGPISSVAQPWPRPKKCQVLYWNAIARGRTLLVGIGLLGPLCLGTFAHAAAISTGINQSENILFNFTKDGNDVVGDFTVNIRPDGTPRFSAKIPAGTPFNYRKLYPQYNGIGADFSFVPPKGVTDWKKTITYPRAKSDVTSGNLVKVGAGLQFAPLASLPPGLLRIPDLAPGPDSPNPDLTIYTAVNLSLYEADNPEGFLSGNWSVGQSLSALSLTITDGTISGVEGIEWSTAPFVVALSSPIGVTPVGGSQDLLNSASFATSIIILSEDDLAIPEPGSSGALVLAACAALTAVRRKRKPD